MKQFKPMLVAAILLSIFLAACTPTSQGNSSTNSTPTPASLSFTDGLNRQITLKQPAQKIISLAPSNTEILFAIGAGKQVIGRDDFSNYPAEASNIPSIGGSMGEYNLEEITRLQPDLILATGINTPEQIKALEDLGLTAYFLPNPTSIEGVFENIKTVGQMTGHQNEADTLVTNLQQRVDAVQKALTGANDHPKVFYELDGTDPAKPWTAGPDTFIDYLIQMAGGTNVGSSLSGEWAQISQEALITENPDIILLGDSTYGGMTPEQVSARPGWNSIKAVSDGQVLTFNDDLVSRPGPRVVDGLVALAKILHPDLAKDLK